ncbi:hypothetical protein BCR35DRAFT_307105 [Leucosporidium creatinivorum]|uniref:C2 domain-containing protein n=1 Tax=Leucosporidium creatinivorum TaxID=106004 RepID=A0A1Y2ES20_9BASI|nr:hypothetical protein BCR35DRAFT_307105 [Leucosporidium creatinivorum]
MANEPPGDSEEAGLRIHTSGQPTTNVWERLDVPPPEPLVKQLGIDLVNYTEMDLPAAELKEFEAYLNGVWIKGSVVICSIVVMLGATPISPGFSVVIVVLGFCIIRRIVENGRKDFAWDVERRRGTEPKQAYESVEWLNHVVKSVWPILDPDLFVAGVDLLEDSLKTLSPAVVRTVRVSSVEQGTNSMRILGLRHLPDDMDIAATASEGEKPSEDPTGAQIPLAKEAETSDPGKFINVEATFAYRRLPPPASKGANAHFIVHMGFGVRKLIKVEVPVWVELSGIVGTIRLRLEMISEPPFVRHVKFCFPTLPQVDIVAKPLGMLDVMTVPGVTSYVTASINTVLNYFVAPKSYTIDLSRFFLGSDVHMKTRSIGVVFIVLHSATNLKAADFDGKADPYVEISLAHVGRVLYTSKIRPHDLNPVWEELACFRIEVESLDEQDNIRLNVLDHDRYSRNDAMGSVLIPLQKLSTAAGEWSHQTSDLETARGSSHPKAGRLSWSAAFFGLASLAPPAPKTNDGATASSTARPTSKASKQSYMERAKPEEDSRSAEYAQRMREMLDGRAPASPSQKTGILAFQVHQLAELECRRTFTTRKAHEDLPSSYVGVFRNDEKIFQTRVKPLSAAPYVNAASEIFCNDWTTARLDFAVMDYRDRDHDVLIGFVSLSLADVLAQRSQVTKWAPIVGGAGHGRLRFSVLFKPLDLVLPRPLLEWNVGTLEVLAARIAGLESELGARLAFEVEGGGKASISSSGPLEPASEGAPTRELDFALDEPLSIPVLSRSAPVIIKLNSSHSFLRRTDAGSAALWLNTIAGAEQVEVEIPLNSDHTPSAPALPTAADIRSKKRKPPAEKADQPSRPSSPRAPSSSSSSSTLPTLHLTLRWHAGIVPAAHGDIILDAPAAARATFQLAIHRLEHEAREAGVLDEEVRGDGKLEQWVEDEAGEPRLKSIQHVKGKVKRFKQHGGTMKWMAHGVKLASRKVKGSTKHNVRGPVPETEIQSVL